MAYRVETIKQSELLRMWLEDDPKRGSQARVPPCGDVYTSITDEYGCVWVGVDDTVPPHLVDRTVEHYLNERASQRASLVSHCIIGETVQFVWRDPD
jgi:hypothetical protein